MDAHAAAARDVADHRVARHRLAALGVAHHQPVDALDAHALRRAAHAIDEPLERPSASAALRRSSDVRDRARFSTCATLTSPCPIDAIRWLRVGQVERLRRRLELRRRRASAAGAACTSRSRISRPSFADVCVLLVPQPLPDLVPRAPRAHVRQPVAARLRAYGDVMISTVSEFLSCARERRDPPVDLRARAVQPDLGVHREREVDRRRALRQLDDVAGRREDEDLVLVQVELEELEELVRRLRVELQLEHLAEPVQVPVELVGALRVLLVRQCAAMPNSAVRCISRVRIWISNSCRPGPKTVVCSDW